MCVFHARREMPTEIHIHFIETYSGNSRVCCNIGCQLPQYAQHIVHETVSIRSVWWAQFKPSFSWKSIGTQFHIQTYNLAPCACVSKWARVCLLEFFSITLIANEVGVTLIEFSQNVYVNNIIKSLRMREIFSVWTAQAASNGTHHSASVFMKYI